MIDRDAPGLDGHVRVASLASAEALFQVRLQCTLQALFTLLGEPNSMIVMVGCAVGTELDRHASMVSKPPDENLQPMHLSTHDVTLDDLFDNLRTVEAALGRSPRQQDMTQRALSRYRASAYLRRF